MSEPPKRDWQKTAIHFACGFAAGGTSFFVCDPDSWRMALFVGLVTGTLAGIYLDRFWEHFQAWW